MLVAIGFLRLGTFIKYIPYPVTVGFTAGIAVIIFSGELADSVRSQACRQGTGTANSEIYRAVRRRFHRQPGSRVSSRRCDRRHCRGAALAAALAGLPDRRARWQRRRMSACIFTSRRSAAALAEFRDSLPAPHLPMLSPEKMLEMLPAALSFTLLGSIESLLSAVVADSMTGRRHRSNAELVAQGVRQYRFGTCLAASA